MSHDPVSDPREDRLESAEQLPPLQGDHLRIVWDMETLTDGETLRRLTVLRCGDRVLWAEDAVWAGYERFEEILKILRTRYGARLAGVEVSQASGLHLYGDRLWTVESVKRLREEIAALHDRGA